MKPNLKIKSIAKKILLSIPPVKVRYRFLQEMIEQNQTLRNDLIELNGRFQTACNYAVLNARDGYLTERLLSHSVGQSLPRVSLVSVPPEDKVERVEIAERLILAYHKACSDEKISPMKREGEDLWTSLIRHELPELMGCIERRDPVSLAEFLKDFGRSYVWFGGITTCIDGYNKNLDPTHIAITYMDKLVSLAEYLGVLRVENPEGGPFGANLHSNVEELVDLIEDELGISISAPMGIVHTDGLGIGAGAIHYRHINALYSAIRAVRTCRAGASICEIGGGLGMTAMYARRLGIQKYTILDLPITCLLAGHYLAHAIGSDNVYFYGEKQVVDDGIQVLPYWECLNLEENAYDLVLNQDSLPEVADNLIMEYLSQIRRFGVKYFLSLNHEYFYPRTVRNFARQSGGFREVYRSKSWVREGYLEELYEFS